jgi:hypothetical protein
MNKYLLFVVLAMNVCVAVRGMELEKYIDKDHIFVWNWSDKKYHAVIEEGCISESVLQKNYQEHKIYRAQLVIQKNKEDEKDQKYFVKTTQELVCHGTETKYENLRKPNRIVMPIASSQEQCTTMRYRLRSCFDRKTAVLAIDNDGNNYFITHIYDENQDNSKKVRVYDAQKVGFVTVPLLSKKQMALKMYILEKEVEQLKLQVSKKLFSDRSEDIQMRVDQYDRNRLMRKRMGYIACAALIAGCIYVYQILNHQYQA